ncbi:2-dehydro-3-deoxyphosphooctonate aldolase (KDO 8-P synthase) [Salipiger thiooxidans]|uniref:2-dehydro-3-deoxyphosphooctonate aldolase n=1 Tax=Salipiger thiooxidans TaxID=282683 RepID=A0A1G7MU46_9RHOB|nr:3-deoxy-8-phosphooctulonate synthase [Salipiger thiooxidans]MBN8189912.1 3-deoxy-8-phosphooctulonate synthase [Salipiger thiooxidans]SDF65335.1 2-dehydro-3-deoxyphosphooctonate aldolase (KDO 8-P synthase) [Salipiger thiooxidans]
MSTAVSAREVAVKSVTFANDAPLALIAGPCQLESLEHARMLAERIAAAAEAARMPWVFKGSFDKANRSSLSGKRGLGMEAGLSILSKIGAEFGVPVLTDIHDIGQCAVVAEAVDILQIPAFLSRQTDLLLAAGETGAAINVKKGQFLAPWDMANVAAKIASTGNQRLMLCERGASFGYNMLVSDMRSLPIMAETGYPVVFDATHSVQLPGGQGTSSGGQRQFVGTLARAAVAVGCAAVFIETHEDPDNAPSDGPNMVPIDGLAPLLARLHALDEVVKP